MLIRSKNEAQQEVLSLTNQLRNKQSEVNRKETEIERLKKEKSQVEISLNSKIKELKDQLKPMPSEFPPHEEVEELKKQLAQKDQEIKQLRNNFGLD